MKDKNSAKLLDNLKSCLIELGFSQLNKEFEEDTKKFKVGIQDKELRILMEFDFGLRANVVNLRLTPTLEFESPDMLAFYQLINTLNRKLMDIGHYSINEADKEVLLQTSIAFSDQNIDREQMLETIRRIILQGLEGFKLLIKMLNGDQSPYQVLESYMTEKLGYSKLNNKITH